MRICLPNIVWIAFIGRNVRRNEVVQILFQFTSNLESATVRCPNNAHRVSAIFAFPSVDLVFETMCENATRVEVVTFDENNKQVANVRRLFFLTVCTPNTRSPFLLKWNLAL